MNRKKKYVCIIIVLFVGILFFIGKLSLTGNDLKIANVSENNIIQDDFSNEVLEDYISTTDELETNTQREEQISYNQEINNAKAVVTEEIKQGTISKDNKTIVKNDTIKSTDTTQKKQQVTNNNKVEETKPSTPQKVETPEENNQKVNDSYTENDVKVAEKKECEGNNHKMSAGNTGLWFETKAQADNYYNSQIEKWGKLWENDEITKEEYLKKCPSGYEVWTCPQCKKWTINFYYR